MGCCGGGTRKNVHDARNGQPGAVVEAPNASLVSLSMVLQRNFMVFTSSSSFPCLCRPGELGDKIAFSRAMCMVEALQHHSERHQRGPCAPPMMRSLAVFSVRGAGDAAKCGKSILMAVVLSLHW
jgi:hypothetical protein